MKVFLLGAFEILKDLIIELQKNLEFRNNVILHWVIAGMVSILQTRSNSFS